MMQKKSRPKPIKE